MNNKIKSIVETIFLQRCHKWNLQQIWLVEKPTPWFYEFVANSALGDLKPEDRPEPYLGKLFMSGSKIAKLKSAKKQVALEKEFAQVVEDFNAGCHPCVN